VDIRDLGLLRRILEEERPDVVVHMAALGDADSCERDRGLAWETTVKPSIAIANWASKNDVFYSLSIDRLRL
jgi:dTDP-4-dehydrorhamnose reductase